MIRDIIIRKDIDKQTIDGYFITETEKETTIQHVTGNLLTGTVKRDKAEVHKGKIADSFINSLQGYRFIRDHITEHKPTGFRVIDNLKNQVVASYNWQ